MPICPNGCGVNHRSGPTPKNCARYTSRVSGTTLTARSVRAQQRKQEPTSTQKKRSSVAVNQDGSPMTFYHGSDADFDSFDEEFTGTGNDTWGSGFYMTTSESIASGYGGTLKRVQLNISNPYRVSADKPHLDDYVHFSAAESAEILNYHPDIDAQPDDEERFNPLGDYIPEFYDKDHWSEKDLDAMRQRMAEEYFDGAPWSHVESTFDRGKPTEQFRRGVAKVTGRDGIVVDFEDGYQTWVAWFPEQIRTL